MWRRSFVFILCFTFFFPLVSSAALVACDGPASLGGVPCNYCTLAQTVQRVLDFVVGILILIAVIWLAITGLEMAYTAAGNGNALELLKKRVTNIIIGFFLVISAWMLIDLVIKVLVADEKVRNWQSIVTMETGELCGSELVPTGIVREGELAADPHADLATPAVAASGEMTHAEAMAIFDGDPNISVVSRGKCSDRSNPRCTSLDGLRTNTFNRVRQLQNAVGAPIVITGATETGHSKRGSCTHGNGCKVDFRTTPELNRYIEDNFEKIPGTTKWRDPNGNIYFRHGPNDHWDVAFYN